MYHGVAIVGKRFSKILRSIDSTQVAVKAAACRPPVAKAVSGCHAFFTAEATLGPLFLQHRLMSQGLTPTNLIGNAVATLAVARWENALDDDQLQRQLKSD